MGRKPGQMERRDTVRRDVAASSVVDVRYCNDTYYERATVGRASAAETSRKPPDFELVLVC